MKDVKKCGKEKWNKPEAMVINVREYENAILANANSICGIPCGGGCGINCGWKVTGNMLLK